MKRIVYAGARLLTGDEIADAVLEYGAALAESEAAETVQIPVLTEEGRLSTATLLLGPSSQIVAEDEVTEFDELLDPDAVEGIQAKTRAYRPTVRSTPDREDGADDHGAWTDDY
ncbi:hypothetical protein [Microbacterium sp. P01]|uniref:hypothetical protein n=1 Tax=unclassified Microbacterium TaxID=2609290 RepID=UPI00366F3928